MKLNRSILIISALCLTLPSLAAPKRSGESINEASNKRMRSSPLSVAPNISISSSPVMAGPESSNPAITLLRQADEISGDQPSLQNYTDAISKYTLALQMKDAQGNTLLPLLEQAVAFYNRGASFGSLADLGQEPLLNYPKAISDLTQALQFKDVQGNTILPLREQALAFYNRGTVYGNLASHGQEPLLNTKKAISDLTQALQIKNGQENILPLELQPFAFYYMGDNFKLLAELDQDPIPNYGKAVMEYSHALQIRDSQGFLILPLRLQAFAGYFLGLCLDRLADLKQNPIQNYSQAIKNYTRALQITDSQGNLFLSRQDQNFATYCKGLNFSKLADNYQDLIQNSVNAIFYFTQALQMKDDQENLLLPLELQALAVCNRGQNADRLARSGHHIIENYKQSIKDFTQALQLKDAQGNMLLPLQQQATAAYRRGINATWLIMVGSESSLNVKSAIYYLNSAMTMKKSNGEPLLSPEQLTFVSEKLYALSLQTRCEATEERCAALEARCSTAESSNHELRAMCEQLQNRFAELERKCNQSSSYSISPVSFSSEDNLEEIGRATKLEIAQKRASHLETLKELEEVDLEKIARVIRGKSNASYNCSKLSRVLIEYFRNGTLEVASSTPSTIRDFSYFLDLVPNSSSVKTETAKTDENVELGSPSVRYHARVANPGVFSGLLPHTEQASITANGELDLIKTLIDLTEENHPQDKALFDELPAHLQALARENPHGISFGIVNLARGPEISGHMLVYFAKPSEVFFIEAQDIVNGKGNAVVKEFKERYSSSDSSFLSTAYYIPIGPL